MSEVIGCKHVSFKYNSVHALKDFSLNVNRGEVVALLGPNGAGKTTSIRVLNGLLTPESGAINVLGFDPRQDGAQIRARTGVLTETPALYERLTARQNLTFFGSLSDLSRSEVEERSNRLLEVFNLQQRSQDRVETFSKGMKQRLALARALLHDPELLFLDEPTSDLDPEAAKQVQDLILEISGHDNRTVILCTHRLLEAEKLCDRVAIMKNGRVAAAGTLDELRSQVFPMLQVYFHLVGKADETLVKLLSQLPGANEVKALSDGEVTLSVDSEDRIPAMVSALVNAGAAIKAVEPRRATLEDIYLRLQHAGEEM
ncbi:MAG: ABC transporter ATP-binding protein [Pelolinea sp.]|nr:ABC transporter ATP-binding protein [Pelolinea sp.]